MLVKSGCVPGTQSTDFLSKPLSCSGLSFPISKAGLVASFAHSFGPFRAADLEASQPPPGFPHLQSGEASPRAGVSPEEGGRQMLRGACGKALAQELGQEAL